MECNCKHKSVCKYKEGMIKAFDPILERVFGGTNSAWDKISRVIREVCKYRPKEQGGEGED